tara:strand:- start:354 stop:683 length:330 start_codon:yes stop_codon:yes gene_type:complete
MDLCLVLLLWIGVIMPKDLITMNNVNIQPLMESLVELVKDKKMTGELDDLINARLPEKSSADWKLICGVLCNSVVEWVAMNKDGDVQSMDLLKHLQSDIGYIMKRLGLS